MDKKYLKRLALKKVKRAMLDYGLVGEGDRVAVGLSGGKDSGVLLYVLDAIRKTVPFQFEIVGVFLDLGFGIGTQSLEDFCRRFEVPFVNKATDIGEIIFEIRKERNPCGLCSNMRKGALNDLAIELGCNKVALGHHLDDLVDTYFMSLFYAGQFKTFSPNTYLSRANIHMIRPMVYLEQEVVRELAALEAVPIIKNPCPANGITKREEIKKWVEDLRIIYPDIREKVLAALKSADLNNLWPVALPRLQPGRGAQQIKDKGI